MTEASKVHAYRFVYGKVVHQPGGPVQPGFEHRPTSVSNGMPNCLLPYCRPTEFPDRDAQIPSPFNDDGPVEPVELCSTSPADLVHPGCTREGALYFAPCCCGGQRYMIATCLRARPELGDVGLGRTHTQLVSFAFAEVDWNQHAPWLLANAGRWLRAEPDLVEFHRGGDYPMAEFGPELLLERPPCEQGPLPPPGTLLWCLAAALENNAANLLIGTADRIDSVTTFLRALACTVALLPQPLRIYLTAAAGFRQAQTPFAIQYLPDASAMADADPGFFQQIGSKLLMEDPEADQQRWQDYWVGLGQGNEVHGGAMRFLTEPPYPKGAEAARGRLTKAIDWIAVQHSVKDLEDCLDGKRPDPPPRPALHYPRTGVEWISMLSRRLNEVIADEKNNMPGAATALTMLATLIDIDGSKKQQQVRYWAKAWILAAGPVGQAHKADRNILRWSALSASPLLERWEDAAGEKLGWLKDFSELGAIWKAIECANAEAPASANMVSAALSSGAFNHRLEDLRTRADQVLIRYPRSLTDLAASFPALLKSRVGDDKFNSDSVTQTVTAIRVAAQLYGWIGMSRPSALDGLGDAARAVADASFGIHPTDDALKQHLRQYPAIYLRVTLRRYWQWALAPNNDRDLDSLVWSGAASSLLEYLVSELGLTDTANLLWRIYQPAYEDIRDELEDLKKVKTASPKLIDACLDALVPSTMSSMDIATDLLRAIPDPAELAADTVPFQAFVSALWQRILDVVASGRTSGSRHLLAEGLLPTFIEFLQRAGQTSGNAPSPETTWRLLDLFDRLLKRWLESGTPPRAKVVDILNQLEGLAASTSSGPRVPGIRQGAGIRLPEVIEHLPYTLGDCLIAWAHADPPEPWLESNRALNASPIRRQFAQTLGFPQCVYFGGLISSQNGIDVNSVKNASSSIPPDYKYDLNAHLHKSTDRYERVIAYGASRCWQTLFSGTLQERDTLKARVTELGGVQALQAIANLGIATSWGTTIDPETLCAVAFFVSLRDPESRAARVKFPPKLEETLLSTVDQHATSYPLQLARLIAIGTNRNAKLGHLLREVFVAPENNRLFTTRILLLPNKGWSDFRFLKGAEQKRYRMLRVLFTFGLIYEQALGNADGQAPRNRLSVKQSDIWGAMQITDASAKGAITKFFQHNANRKYADAFRYAIKWAGIRMLPGWPDEVQPR